MKKLWPYSFACIFKQQNLGPKINLVHEKDGTYVAKLIQYCVVESMLSSNTDRVSSPSHCKDHIMDNTWNNIIEILINAYQFSQQEMAASLIR